MAVSEIKGVTIKGICSVLPAGRVVNQQSDAGIPAEDLTKIISSTGIHARRVVESGQTCLDLAQIAAKALLNDLQWATELPELLIFVTQTPDYMLPNNAVQLQHTLGLPKSTVAFDVNLGCSGFVYGLWQISQLLTALPCRRALLVVGDTTSTLCHKDNRGVALLFGDAVSVIGIEKESTAERQCFELGSDGSGAPYLIQPYGGAKEPERVPSLTMEGTQVFVFTLKQVPKSVKSVMEQQSWSASDVDYVVFHQANKMMVNHLADKLGFTESQVIIAMGDIGNTSSASIPVAITMALAESSQSRPLNLVLSGFGVGWSWGSVAFTLAPLQSCKLISL